LDDGKEGDHIVKRCYHAAILLTLTVAAPFTVAAQSTPARSAQTVLFVCEHGTVRSLLAKVFFEQYAAEVGLHMEAVSRGTRADSTVPDWMLHGLTTDHITLGDWRPQSLRPTDLANAAYVVSFDVPPGSTSGGPAPREQWDGLPSVSKDYAKGRDAIRVRVRALVDSLKRAEKPR
jgi:arsenate reductase